MDLAGLSLAALGVVVVFSCFGRGNPGVAAIALAWGIVAVAAPRFDAPLTTKDLYVGFPTELFLTLLGVSLLFAQTDANGTLARVAEAAERLCRGHAGLVPPLFFLLAAGIGTIGAGNIAAAALLAPVAMAAATRSGSSPFLMALMVGHGAVVGGLSPFTAAGVIAANKLADLGLTNVGWRLYATNAAVNAFVAAMGYVLCGGWRSRSADPAEVGSVVAERTRPEPLSASQWLTLTVVAATLSAVVFAKADLGMTALAGSLLLATCRAADEREVYAKVPWSVIVMVSGISVLASLLDRTGGTKRFAEIVATVSTPETLNAIVAFGTGIVSIYSSTTGVVLPAFLPMVKDLSAAAAGSSPLALATSVLIGGNIVDVSPLSTVGALCLAASPSEWRRSLFRKLLAWGFGMAVVAAIVCGTVL